MAVQEHRSQKYEALNESKPLPAVIPSYINHSLSVIR